jgi:hypothetical protein
MNLVAVYLLATGRNRANGGVIAFGVVGTIAVVIYARRARAFLRGD